MVTENGRVGLILDLLKGVETDIDKLREEDKSLNEKINSEKSQIQDKMDECFKESSKVLEEIRAKVNKVMIWGSVIFGLLVIVSLIFNVLRYYK